MRCNVLVVTMLTMPFMCIGQNAYEYYGDKVQLEAHYFQSRNMGKLQGDKKQAYQGMDIYEGYLVSAQSSGIVTVYDIKGGELNKEKQLKLSTFAKSANAYNVSFGTQKLSDEDVLPPLYVSGNNGALNVERVEKKFKSVKPVQTITIADVKCSRIDWTVDSENQFLYALCTLKNGTHRVLRFRVPEVSGETVAEVKLKSSQAIDQYLVEDYYQGATLSATQGAYIHDGLLYITSGNGTPKSPSRLYVWDLYGKMMRNVIDLSTATRGELSACSVYDGALLVQSTNGLYKLVF